MKNLLKSAAAVLCLVLPLAGCGKAGGKVLHVAIERNSPPFSYVEDGKVRGIDAELLKEIALRLNCRLELHPMNFGDIIPAVQKGKYRIGAGSITITEERRKKVLFSLPYVTSGQVLVVPVDSPVKRAVDLANPKYRIGVQQTTTGDQYAVRNLHEPVRFESVKLAIAALAEKKIEAVICDSLEAEDRVNGNSMLKILPIPLTYEEYAFIFPQGETTLQKAFDKEFLAMRKSGRLREIVTKYEEQGE